MTPKRVRVFAPASISNLGPGYDVLGLAIDQPGDYAIAKRVREPGLSFSVRGDGMEIPTTAKDNVAGHVASLMLEEFTPGFGVDLVLEKKMPIGSGLGSSAASSVAAAVAVNALLPKPLRKTELLRFAVEGERKASGSPHADNAAPSLLGGLCLIRSYDPLDVISVGVRNNIVWVVVHPQVVVKTEEARRILPKDISMRNAVRQWGNVGGLMVGLIEGDAQLLGRCIEDVIVEPVRATLIPGFQAVKEAAMRAGAYGCSISGSGPSVFAVTDSIRSAKKIGAEMIAAFERAAGVKSNMYVSRVNMRGARISSHGSK